MTEVDICEECGEPFGFSGEDENGYNASCVRCGNNTYFTIVSESEGLNDRMTAGN